MKYALSLMLTGLAAFIFIPFAGGGPNSTPFFAMVAILFLFTMAERVDMAKAILVGLPNVRVMSFSGLVTDFARDIGASLIVRGLRDASDFDYERRMASLNRILQPTIDTHFIIPDDRYQSITGTLVREIAMMGGDVRAFVNPVVLAALQEKYLKRQQEPRKESR